MKIREVISKRGDLSTFLVHLTKRTSSASAKDCLKSILKSGKIFAGSPLGMAYKSFTAGSTEYNSQRVVSFTETPLEYLHLMSCKIEGRNCDFEPYGIAITKRQGRTKGLNPIWYTDMTPGHDWLSNYIDELRELCFEEEGDLQKCFLKIAPFFEQMGAWANRKEFWWEREWRLAGNFLLPLNFIVVCPEKDMKEVDSMVKNKEIKPYEFKCIDPAWSLEQIIAYLAGFDKTDVEIL